MEAAKQILIIVGLIIAALFVAYAIINTIINNLIGFIIFGSVGIGGGSWFAHNTFKKTELPDSEKQHHIVRGALLGFITCFVVAIFIFSRERFSPTGECSRDIGKFASRPVDC